MATELRERLTAHQAKLDALIETLRAGEVSFATFMRDHGKAVRLEQSMRYIGLGIRVVDGLEDMLRLVKEMGESLEGD